VPAIAPDQAAPDTRAPKAPETKSFVFSPSVYGRFRFAPGSAALGVDAGKALDLIAQTGRLVRLGRRVPLDPDVSCVNRCEIGWDIAIAHKGDVCPPGTTCPIPQGSCSEFFGNSRCHGWIDQDDKGTRTTKWMCVD
jgi:hypothetical protein